MIAHKHKIHTIVHCCRDYLASTTKATQPPSCQPAQPGNQETYQVLATPGQRIQILHGWRRVTYTGTRYAVPPNPYDRGVWSNVAELCGVTRGAKSD